MFFGKMYLFGHGLKTMSQNYTKTMPLIENRWDPYAFCLNNSNF